MFAVSLDQHAYDLVRNAAARLADTGDRWPGLRSGMLATLRKKKHWGTLTDIFLAEGAVADAVATFRQADGAARSGRNADTGFGWMPTGFNAERELRLAQAAERDFPDEAATVLRAAGRGEEWDASIAALRLQHKSLHALREEIDALGLG